MGDRLLERCSTFGAAAPCLARAKTVDEAITEFKRLKDPTCEVAEENPYEAKVIEESELVLFIEAGWEIVKELDDGQYIMRRPNQHS